VKQLSIIAVFLAFNSGAVLIRADPLPSWNDGVAKQAILNFVFATTNPDSPNFVPANERIATFDQDGTLWVEQPMYPQVMYALDRVAAIVKEKPHLRNFKPFKMVLSEGVEAIKKLDVSDLELLLVTALSGMSVEQFQNEVKTWIAKAKHPRWNRLYKELTYQPMQEVLDYFRDHQFETYIVTGGGQDFVRVYSEETYGIPVQKVVGTVGGTHFCYNKEGQAQLIKEPKLLLNDDSAGKPKGIHLVIGRRPIAAFGNSIGDRQMLEYTTGTSGSQLAILILHDDPVRAYAYGPAQKLPHSKVGTFTQALYDQAKRNNWIIVSMKNDWKRIFSFAGKKSPAPKNSEKKQCVDILKR